MLLKNKALLISSTLLITGCATMFGNNTRKVRVDSVPRDAGIYIDGQKQGYTPATVTLPTYIYGGTKIIVKQEDYDDTAIQINSEFQLIGLLNILNGFIGFIIDIADGNVVKISPESLHVDARLKEKPNLRESKPNLKESKPNSVETP